MILSAGEAENQYIRQAERLYSAPPIGCECSLLVDALHSSSLETWVIKVWTSTHSSSHTRAHARMMFLLRSLSAEGVEAIDDV